MLEMAWRLKSSTNHHSFIRNGYTTTEYFAHAVEIYPRQLSDSTALLISKGLLLNEIECGRRFQLRLRQCFAGTPGANPDGAVMATAGLFAWQSRLFVVKVALAGNRETSTVLGLLLNAVLDLALDDGYEKVYIPASPACDASDSGIPYGCVPKWFSANYVRIRAAAYWSLSVPVNDHLIVRLPPSRPPQSCAPRRTSICVAHTWRGPDVANGDVFGSTLQAILDDAKSEDASVTICLPANLYQRTQHLLVGTPHDIAFAGYDGSPARLGDIAKCRSLTTAVTGYRVPTDEWTPEMSDFGFSYNGFDWVLYRAAKGADHARAGCAVAHLPVTMDDRPLISGAMSFEAWVASALVRSQQPENTVLILELSASSSAHWLPRYRDCLRSLGSTAEVTSCSVIAERLLGRTVSGWRPHGRANDPAAAGPHQSL